MSETEAKPASPAPPSGNSLATVQPPVLQVACRMLRSPSHESVTTSLSLVSASSTASDAIKCGNRLVPFKSCGDGQLSGRGPSPNPDTREIQGSRPPDIPEILWFEEETELIRSFGALAAALGLQKSFSTSDVSQLPAPEIGTMNGLRSAVSAIAIDTAHRNGFLLEQARLENASRSCSTWVAVGDPASTSQLPSPHGGTTQQTLGAPHNQTIPFTAVDLVRSVNKKARQNYLRRKALTTYRAMERFSQSEFNLDRLEAAASAAQTAPAASLVVPGVPSVVGTALVGRENPNHLLTRSDIERERGKQLTKYERNMMIFNWLHTLVDAEVEDSIQ